MAEAVRDFKESTCGNNKYCYIDIDDLSNYKRISACRSEYKQFEK